MDRTVKLSPKQLRELILKEAHGHLVRDPATRAKIYGDCHKFLLDHIVVDAVEMGDNVAQAEEAATYFCEKMTQELVDEISNWDISVEWK